MSAAEVERLRKVVADVEKLHRPVEVWEVDDLNGVWVLGDNGDKKLLHKWCSECTDLAILQAVEDLEWWDGCGEGVDYPCATVVALGGEAPRTAEVVLKPADRRELMEALKGKVAVEVSFGNGVSVAVAGDVLRVTWSGGEA